MEIIKCEDCAKHVILKKSPENEICGPYTVKCLKFGFNVRKDIPEEEIQFCGCDKGKLPKAKKKK